MTNFKCPKCDSHWSEGPTRDHRTDVVCRKCLQGIVLESATLLSQIEWKHKPVKVETVEALLQSVAEA